MDQMIVKGWGAHVELADGVVTIVRTRFSPGLPERVPIRLPDVTGIHVKAASRLSNGWVQIQTGQSTALTGNMRAANDPHTVHFTRGQQDEIERLAGWLRQVAAINQTQVAAVLVSAASAAPSPLVVDPVIQVEATVAVPQSSPTGGYAVFDLETTGLFPRRNDRIVEVAVVQLDPEGNVEREWATLVNPNRDVGPTHIHGITAREVIHAPTFVDIADELADLFVGRAAVAHNISFDSRFLAAAYERIESLSPIDTQAELCTMRLASRYVPASNRRLETCCTAVGIDLLEAHSALGDTRATAQLFSHMLHKHGHDPVFHPVRSAAMHARRASVASKDPVVLFPRSAVPVRPGTWLSRLAESVPTGDCDEYVALLDRCLLDHALSAREEEALIELATSLGLTRQRAKAIHLQYVRDLAATAWADGIVTDQERDDLHRAAAHLGVTDKYVDEVLARPIHADREARPAVVLAVGDRVSFTGDLKFGRNQWQERAAGVGLKVDGVTKLTRVLVAADPDTMSGKGQRAEKYGTAIVDEDAFASLIAPLET